MSNVACGRCGADPAAGYATIGETRFCHEAESPTCYEQASWGQSLGNPQALMTTVTIFQSPLDYPGKFVARAFAIFPGQEPVPAEKPICVVDTLEEARAAVAPLGLYPLARSPEDHVSVVETYI